METRRKPKQSADLDKPGIHRLEEAMTETLRETLASTARCRDGEGKRGRGRAGEVGWGGREHGA